MATAPIDDLAAEHAPWRLFRSSSTPKFEGLTLSGVLQGGFLPDMTRTEAARILGVRESAAEERVKDAHRRLMVANHPDSGGSSHIAAKVNEAKDMLLGKTRRGGSAF